MGAFLYCGLPVYKDQCRQSCALSLRREALPTHGTNLRRGKGPKLLVEGIWFLGKCFVRLAQAMFCSIKCFLGDLV